VDLEELESEIVELAELVLSSARAIADASFRVDVDELRILLDRHAALSGRIEELREALRR
jgi:hypothetical protein